MLTKEHQNANAVENHRNIKCYAPYLKAFKNGTITMYEGFGGYYVEEEEILNKIHEVENEYGGTVYAVIHQITNIGELYTFLWATAYEEDSQYDVEDYGNGQYAVMSYVWNKTYDDCSEFGSVVIKPALGGLVRVA